VEISVECPKLGSIVGPLDPESRVQHLPAHRVTSIAVLASIARLLQVALIIEVLNETRLIIQPLVSELFFSTA